VKKQKVIIADGNRIFREGLRRILLNMGGVEVVAEVDDGIVLLELLKRRRVDIVFLDLLLQGADGYEVVQHGQGISPSTRFIAFTSLESPRYVRRMVMAGASGYLLKSVDNQDLLFEIITGQEKTFCLSPGMQAESLHFENQEAIS
jgi:DNA-binding NarL/FixJ family response regulator